MMRLASMAIMAFIFTGSATHLLANEGGPVCRQQSVVTEMTRQIRVASYYSKVDPRLVTEQPTVNPRIVRCQVCVEYAPYDTIRFGDRPVGQCLAHGFEVEIFPAGFVVYDRG